MDEDTSCRNSSHTVKVRRKMICLYTLDTHLQFLAVTLMQTSQSSSSLLSTSLAEALISNVASLMSSPARLYRISFLITVLTLDTTLSWRKLFKSSMLRSQLLFTSCNRKFILLTIFSSHILKLFSHKPMPMLLYMCDLFSPTPTPRCPAEC